MEDKKVLIKRLLQILAKCWLLYLIVLLVGVFPEIILEKTGLASRTFFSADIRWIYAAFASIVQFYLLIKWTRDEANGSVAKEGTGKSVHQGKLYWLKTVSGVIVVGFIGIIIPVVYNVGFTLPVIIPPAADMRTVQNIASFIVAYFNQAGMLFFLFNRIVPDNQCCLSFILKDKLFLLVISVIALEAMPLSILSDDFISIALLISIYLAVWKKGCTAKNILVLHLIFVLVAKSIHFCSFPVWK
ncbi:MAG: hypothetical protein WCV63_07790 [Negativicutes bacterium]